MLRFRFVVFLSALLLVSALASAQQTPLTISGDHFELNGKPFQIVSGEMHYQRIPRARWDHDLAMARAMGLNAVTVYSFWNAHEPQPGLFDFSGNNDVAAFLRAAQQHGLYVILRPGPYVCAEWEWGGFPAWLGKDPAIPLRTTDPRFMKPARAWLARLGKELAPLQAANGGPILAVQVENEYGNYGKDLDYIRAIRQAIVDGGLNKTFLYQTDGASDMAHDHVPGLFAADNFGIGRGLPDIKAQDEKTQKAIGYALNEQPGQPVLVGEYWDGWFEHWGSRWERTNAEAEARELGWMLKKGYSVSIYMFVGGTSFGWMNGANSGGNAGSTTYEPDVTSYDYDAALQEDGQPGRKYALFREAISKATGVAPPAVPSSPAPQPLPAVTFTESASLWDSLPAPNHAEHPLTMEALGQSYGYILYRTHVDGPVKGTLAFDGLHQYATVYANGKLLGTVDRRLKQRALEVELAAAATQLDILVENTGRINYGPNIMGEQIGIVGDAHLAGKMLTGWEIYNLPMDNLGALHFTAVPCEGPCFTRAVLPVGKPVDTYLDTRSLGKGMLFVNQQALGRFWSIGPQGSLYLPSSWLHAGKNEVIAFDLFTQPKRSIGGVSGLITDVGGVERRD